MVSLRAVDDAHEADLRFKWLMEALHLPITGVFELLHHLKEVASGISTALEYHDSQWQALVDLKEAQRDELLLECDELQSRYDWLLTRWSAREPRQQDVRMISALQDELSRIVSAVGFSLGRGVCVCHFTSSCANAHPLPFHLGTQANANNSASCPGSSAVQRGVENQRQSLYPDVWYGLHCAARTLSNVWATRNSVGRCCCRACDSPSRSSGELSK